MLIILTTMALLGCSAVLWWKLGREQEHNSQLRAEIIRLRGKLRTLLP